VDLGLKINSLSLRKSVCKSLAGANQTSRAWLAFEGRKAKSGDLTVAGADVDESVL
jgi:hypothetical protein